MNIIFNLLHDKNMKTKYYINKNELTINLDFFYEFIDNHNKISNIKKYINYILKNNNIKFKGKKITVYKNGIMIGIFYLTNYYLNKKLNFDNNFLTDKNSFFDEYNYVEINNNQITKSKKILSLY